VLLKLLQLMRVFGDYLWIEYLWHVPIMPLTNRNGIRMLTSENSEQAKFADFSSRHFGE
jgi:hypothetical protein